MLSRRHLLLPALLPLAACSATGALNALVPRSTYRLQEGIAYGPSPRHRLDAYLPEGGARDAPLVVFFYGGDWTRGERGDYRFVGEALASAGTVTVVADYRLSPAVRWTGILEDCAAAVRWCADNAARLGASRRRMHLMGHSAGAYNAAMLALDRRWLGAQQMQPADLAGWIGIAGPYNFLPIEDPEVQRTFDWPNTPAASQPVAHVSAQAPRTLLLTPREDQRVDPDRNSGVLAERLHAAGVPVRLSVLDGVSHVTIVGALGAPLRGLAPVRQEVLGFVAG